MEEAQAALWGRDENWPEVKQEFSFEFRDRLILAFSEPPRESPELSAVRSAWAGSLCVFDRICGLLDITELKEEILRSLIGCLAGITLEKTLVSARRSLVKHCECFGFELVFECLVDLLLGAGEPRRVANRQERNNRFISPPLRDDRLPPIREQNIFQLNRNSTGKSCY